MSTLESETIPAGVEKVEDYDPNNILEVRNLRKWFPLSRGIFASLFSEEIFVRAVDDISFNLKRGEILVLAGESGCGKTTTGKTVIRLLDPTAGSIIFNGMDITYLSQRQLRPLRTRMQIIFQDPYESLNPKMNVWDAVSEPLRLTKAYSTKDELEERVFRAIETVRLDTVSDIFDRFPHELSGGQRQRVAVARALTLDPDLIVADEPVSMLDVSIRAELLNLLLEQRKEANIAYLFITHDLATAAYVADRIAIMYLGKIIEIGETLSVVRNPQHPYTAALLDSVPSSNPLIQKKRKVLRGEPPSPINPPSGCRFHPRCPIAKDICAKAEPKFIKITENHEVACHFPLGFSD